MEDQRIEPALITRIIGDTYVDENGTTRIKPLTRDQLKDINEMAQRYPYGMLAINGNMGFDTFWLEDHQLNPNQIPPIDRLMDPEKTISVALFDFGTEERANAWIKAETMKHAGKQPL